MANIDLKLSSKEDKITHRSEILIRFYQGQKIDFRVKTGLFIQPRHFKYFVNRAATKKQGVDIPDKITSVCKDEAMAKDMSLQQEVRLLLLIGLLPQMFYMTKNKPDCWWIYRQL